MRARRNFLRRAEVLPLSMRRLSTAALAAVLPALGAGVAVPAAAQAASRTPSLTALRCVPATASACRSGVQLRVGRQLQLRGTRLKAGQRVSFRWSAGALAAKLKRTKAGYVVLVPTGTRPGKVSVTVRDGAGRRSNAKAMTVLPEPAAVTVPRPATTGTDGTPAAFQGDGMWIWQLDKSDGGDLAAIGARARAAGMGTVFVKAADAANPFQGQFTNLLVAGLHNQGLRVCAWQFVYGSNPSGEATAAINAIRQGADCFVIDAETQYEGKYAAAQQYVAAVRAAVGPEYPIGLTSFPYVDYHPSLPYSVFLAPGAAQVNLPQVYWKDIGGSVDAVSAHTLANNRIYGSAIAPLGQTYGSVSGADLRRFRQLWAGYGASGRSWWSWQATPDALWSVLDEPAPAAQVEPDPGWPALGSRSKGDQVRWLQGHLTQTYPDVQVTGTVDAATSAAIEALQTARGLPPTGTTDAATWQAALALPYTAPQY